MTAGEIAALTASGAGLLLVIWLMVVLSQGILLMKKLRPFWSRQAGLRLKHKS
ncbi:hypothetical protein P7H17_15190 [Paenibacillus larvae]|nr:hypothetical protein [Paenibacillus larvae]MDT2258494.1 hypothetical protein [Paenibacillus larvae]MDT2262588.1 hypothetical protein [Paenibacillus larvae]MDT2287108.1 hypothetical protein [Paenibacillus larvae]MDT2294168.1 hypothetical protein [Paenibacillus larvae]MDT2303078.1 hypothetical protein [Paenibacillus larvae]